MKITSIKNNLIIELHVPSFDTAREFYGQFGFREILNDPTSGGGSDLGYLVICRKDSIGDTMINFYGDKEKVTEHNHFKDFPSDTPRGYGIEITIPVSNVKELWEEVVEKLPKNAISQPLTTKRWDKQDFRIVDPFGFYLRFTEIVDWGQK